MKDFKDKVAVITGGASGIGYGIARRCVKEGAKVVLVDVNQKALTEAKSELEAAGATVFTMSADISKASDMEQLAQKTLDNFGEVHLLFNNAGVGVPGPQIWETTLSDWEWVINVNLWGLIHSLRIFVPIMLKQDTECHIVNTASMAGLISPAGYGAYNASKHGVVALSETLHHELTKLQAKIKISVLCPGAVSTNIMDISKNRPAELQNDPKLEAERQAKYLELDKKMRKDIKEGMPTDEVAELVFKAIRDERFYILTHSWAKDIVKIHMEDILHDRVPTALQT
ncbi:MAG: SDR family NAD(P)-dependent oxidoreductase [Pseudomonadota bacterium]